MVANAGATITPAVPQSNCRRVQEVAVTAFRMAAFCGAEMGATEECASGSCVVAKCLVKKRPVLPALFTATSDLALRLPTIGGATAITDFKEI